MHSSLTERNAAMRLDSRLPRPVRGNASFLPHPLWLRVQRYSKTRAMNSLQDLIPRIVEEIPARLPRPDQFRMVEVDRDALMQLIFPEGSSDFLQLSWVIVVFAAVLFAIIFEVSLLAIKIFNSDEDSAGGPGTMSMSSVASIDLDEEEVGSHPAFAKSTTPAAHVHV
eukprot:jgi/Botrbrau1/7959/Bobra.9_2s0115.2